jgi:transposase InsO family protein
MNQSEQIARHRLSVLELAEALGNVSAACRQRGMTRTQFYDYKQRFELQGIEGLKNLPPIHKNHPQTTAPEVVARIVALSLEHPAWGCVRLCEHLKLEGVSVSSPAIQRMLIKQGMASKSDRLFKLQEQFASERCELSDEQISQIEKANPCFRERHDRTRWPGMLLAACICSVGKFARLGTVYLYVVLDTYGSYSFGFLHTCVVPEAAVKLLHHHALPFYHRRGLAVRAVLTDTGWKYCGTPWHHFEIDLFRNMIEHRRVKVRHLQTNGFVQRFRRTVKEEFFEVAVRSETVYESLEALQADFECWLAFYNTKRPHQGYPNMGKSPMGTINAYLAATRRAQ